MGCSPPTNKRPPGIVLKDVVVVRHFNKLAKVNSFHDTNEVLMTTRATVGWQAVRMQMAASDVARKYALERHQFGKPIASFQLIREQLVTVLSNAQAAMGMMVRLAQMEDAGTTRNKHSAPAKAFVTKSIRETVALGRGIPGGNGVSVDHEMAKIFCDAEAFYTYEGSYEINTLVAGRRSRGSRRSCDPPLRAACRFSGAMNPCDGGAAATSSWLAFVPGQPQGLRPRASKRFGGRLFDPFRSLAAKQEVHLHPQLGG